MSRHGLPEKKTFPEETDLSPRGTSGDSLAELVIPGQTVPGKRVV
jgi:hypothetical protein